MATANNSCYLFPKLAAGATAERPKSDRPEDDFRRVALGAGRSEGGAARGVPGTGKAGGEPEINLEDFEQQAYCRGLADGEKSGFDQGKKAGADAAAAELADLKTGLERLLAEIEALHGLGRRELEREMVALALAVARRVTRRELSLQPQAVASMLREALGKVEHASQVSVRLNPQDLGRLNELSLAPGGAARLVADPDVAPGGFLVESDLGDIDARLERQFQAIEEAFREFGASTAGDSP